MGRMLGLRVRSKSSGIPAAPAYGGWLPAAASRCCPHSHEIELGSRLLIAETGSSIMKSRPGGLAMAVGGEEDGPPSIHVLCAGQRRHGPPGPRRGRRARHGLACWPKLTALGAPRPKNHKRRHDNWTRYARPSTREATALRRLGLPSRSLPGSMSRVRDPSPAPLPTL